MYDHSFFDDGVVVALALGGVQRLNFVCAVCYFLCSSVGWVVPRSWILFSEVCVAVTSRLSGADHLFIISLSRELSFLLRLR